MANRLHAVLVDLHPGGVPGAISARKAAKLLDSVALDGPVAAARVELAGELVENLRRADTALADSKRRLAAVVAASRTTTTAVFGVGPVVAATVVGIVGDVSRFPTRDHFAAYNGTAPVEVSSGNHRVYRLSRRGNRRLNHAIHMAAVTQIRHRHSNGRAYYDHKVAEGRTHREALRALKRRISDALYAAMVQDARRTATVAERGPGGQPGDDSVACVAGLHPVTPALRPSHSRTRPQARPAPRTTGTAKSPARSSKPSNSRKSARRAS